jgi:hypothetical protein
LTTFTATGPFVIDRQSNKKADPKLINYLWIGFSDLVPRRFYDPTKAVNTYEHDHTRWYRGRFEYGEANLTDEGRALFDALAKHSAVLELWLAWNWRRDFGDMIRIEFDFDVTDDLVAHIEAVAKRLYGDDIVIAKDIALAA